MDRGILYRGRGRHLEVRRFAPSEDLSPFVECYWFTRWDLDAPYTTAVLPDPAVNVCFERGRSRIVGVPSARFGRRLEGRGRIFAVKFRPGAFRPFFGADVGELSDRIVPSSLVGRETAELLSPEPDPADLDAFLRRLRPREDASLRAARESVEAIQTMPELLTVDATSAALGLGKRSLERLFKEQVGLAPKRVILRFRLQEAVERLQADDPPPLAHIAAELGFCDQAHFTRAFSAAIGLTPGAYVRSLHAPDDSTAEVRAMERAP